MYQTATLKQAEEMLLEGEDHAHWIADIADGIDLLSELERQVIVLYYREELSAKEISIVLEISIKKVNEIHIIVIHKLLNR